MTPEDLPIACQNLYMLDIGDRVRIAANPATEAAGAARREGICFGFTTPSVTGVDVIGESQHDLAYGVGLDDSAMGTLWFAPECVELVSHSPGLTAEVGGVRFERTADGRWERLE